MDWRVDFTIEPGNYLGIHFQRDEEKISVLLYCQWNSLNDLARALVAIGYGAPEAMVLWYDYDNRYPLFNTFVFTAIDDDVLFEIQETDLNKEGHPDSLPLQIRDTRKAICQMFWKGLRRFQGAGLAEQYKSLYGTFPDAEINKLTQLLKPQKR